MARSAKRRIADVEFAASVSSGQNERCISDMQRANQRSGCRICSSGLPTAERALHFRHPAAVSQRGCRNRNNGSFRPKRALHFRHAEGQPTQRMSDLQRRFPPRGTSAAFPTSRLVFPRRMSDLQRRFLPAGTSAAFPTSAHPLRRPQDARQRPCAADASVYHGAVAATSACAPCARPPRRRCRSTSFRKTCGRNQKWDQNRQKMTVIVFCVKDDKGVRA